MSNQKLIESLTPEQEAKIPEYEKRFLEIGLSTAPTDKTAAENAVRNMYKYLGKTNTEFSNVPDFIWAESPFQGATLAAKLAKGSEDVTLQEVRDQAELANYGSFEAYWVSTYAYIAEVLPVQKDELTSIAVDIVTNCGVFWMFEKVVVMTPKPSVIQMKENNLHCEDGPALAWGNGDGIYAINGVCKNSLMEVVMESKRGDKSNGESEAD
jgi:hypothetical protein